jgi:V8-like Glu-specific endopeptidase
MTMLRRTKALLTLLTTLLMGGLATPVRALDLSSASVEYPKGEFMMRASASGGMRPEAIMDDPNFIRISALSAQDPDRRLSSAIGHLIIPLPERRAVSFCTGFLVGESLFMTNHHCLFDKAGKVRRVDLIRVTFDYLRDTPLVPRYKAAEYGVRGAIAIDEDLDYALLVLTGKPGNIHGKLKIDAKFEDGENGDVKIIQHPQGRPKELSRDDSAVLKRSDLFLHYRADTEGGSSGSPVFARNGRQVVALHHVGAPGRYNEGVLMMPILRDIARQINSQETEAVEFVEEYLPVDDRDADGRKDNEQEDDGDWKAINW